MAPRAPATERRLGDAALVLCAHGIRGGVGGAAEHAARIAERRLFAEVRACALKGQPGLREVVAAVRAPEIVFVLLMFVGPSITTQIPESNRTPSQFCSVCLPSPEIENVSL